MAFSHARQRSQVKLSAKEMFEISQEISREFSPNVSSKLRRPALPDKFRRQATSAKSGLSLSPNRFLAWFSPPSRIEFTGQELDEISRDIRSQYGPRFAGHMLAASDSRMRLSPHEIFAISEEISLDFAPRIKAAEPLLVLMPVDPHHLHAYWKFDDQDIKASPGKGPEPPWTLRIYPEPMMSDKEAATASWFDVVIDGAQGHQKITLPSISATRYTAAIGKSQSEQGFTVFVRSNVIFFPVIYGDGHRHPENTNGPGAMTFSRKHASGQGK